MRVGDILYCYRVKNGMNDISSNFEIGQSYEVLSIVLDDNRIYVRTKYGWMEWFNIRVVKQFFDNSEEWYYGNWFYTLQELRMIKLEKLNEYECR